MDIQTSKKGNINLSGFHHDFMGKIEESGLVKLINKVVREHGFYEAQPFVNGKMMAKTKTFFPKDWTRQKVVSKIFDAYDNFKVSGAMSQFQNNGTYLIRGLIDEGVEIEMFITRKGLISTAYPLLKKGF